MNNILVAVALVGCIPALISADGHLDSLSGLSCPSAGYMMPDSNNLCIYHFCERPGEAPIKRPCPKGVRVPSWWEGGTLAMCNIVNILKHGGEPTCLRCAANDEKPADSCADYENPCPDGCTCVDTEHTHRCDCPVELGVIGDGSSVPMPVNHCEPDMCENGASCQNQWDGFFCFCPNGFTGHRCETPICDWHPCLNGGTCVVDEVGYHCDCTECFTGSCCNVTNADCDTGNAIACPPCKTGLDCKTDINSCGCGADPCKETGAGGTCVDADSGPECQACDECMTGPLCKALVDDCKCNNNCPENSRCEDLIDVNSHECICDDCYEGAKCEVKKVNCECNSPCSPDQTCELSNGVPTCGCEDSCFSGANCDQKVNTCECNNPCEAGTCKDTDNGPVCECPDCLMGDTCEEKIISCECANPCPSGETCSQANDGTLSCGCSDPCKTGPGCSETVNSCECANPCNPEQTCSLVGDELTCSCANPCKTGPKCDIAVNTCGCGDPCQNGGECYDDESGPLCRDCDACWTGDKCDEKIVSCECNNPCPADGVCNIVDDKPVCGCPDCFTGPGCDIPVDSCECNNPCTDKNTCKDTDNGAICECDCVGNEECREDKVTGEKACKCPVCYFNKPGEQGCESKVTHLCLCNDPCTGDQQVCVDGPEGGVPQCKIGNPSAGNAFTVVFEENHTEKSIRQIPLELYMTPAVPDSGPRSVNVRSAGLKPDQHCYFNRNLTVQENDVLRVEIDRCMRHNKTGLDFVSIRITELNNDTLIVYGINKDRWTADAFLATPDVQAGTEFQTASYSPAHRATQFAIAALFDDTDIEITLADVNDLPPPYNVKGAKYKMTMNAFETFQVQATCPINKRDKKSSCPKDLTGSIIKASKPIHAFSGNVRAFVKAGEGFSRDHLVEELVPVDRWGKYFGLVSVPGRVVGDVLNIMAVAGQATNVDIYLTNGGGQTDKQSITLPKNGKVSALVDVPSAKRIIIKSDQPLSVTQLTKSKDTYLYFNETVHDPVSITVPPVDQFTNNFFISTPLFSGGENFSLRPYQATYAMLVAKTSEKDSITIDGKAPEFIMPWGPMPAVNGGEELSGAVILVPHGTRLIKSGSGNFQCLIYGFDDRESYGFPAAMNFAKINN